MQRGNYAAASALVDELTALADEKDALFWKAVGIIAQGTLFVLTGKAADAVETITSGITAYRCTGASMGMPSTSSILATAYAELGQLEDAWRCIDEAMTIKTASGETWSEAEVTAYQQRADRAEQWLHRVYTEIEDRFLPHGDSPRGMNGAPQRPQNAKRSR
jgi:hypothetical protein